MPGNYRTPGVYVEEISLFPPSVAAVETAIPAFIGRTAKAELRNGESLHLVPHRIASLLDYETYFGGAKKEDTITTSIQDSYDEKGKLIKQQVKVGFKTPDKSSGYLMHHALKMFYANGGGPCYIVSVDQYEQKASTNNPKEPPSEKKKIEDGIDVLRNIDEVTLLVMPEAATLLEDSDDKKDYSGVITKALEQCRELQDRFTIADVKTSTSPDKKPYDDAESFRKYFDANEEQKKYGAVYYPYLKTSFTYPYDEADVAFAHIVTPPEGMADLDNPPVIPDAAKATTLLELKTENNDYYNLVRQEIDRQLKVILPPGSAVAGLYASVDRDRGVWKAPANVVLTEVIEPLRKMNDLEQADLNIDTTGGKSVNAIRHFTGRGIRVWGARTLLGNDNEWRYVSVRRFFNMVEESVKKATARFVFEPNDANTWVKVRSMIENFLILQWRAGALAGAKPEDAFFVKVGLNETMTALDILEGRMNVEIGMAVVRPAEFIILKFSHKMQVS